MRPLPPGPRAVRQLLNAHLPRLLLIGVELHDIQEGRVGGLRMSIHGIEDYVTAQRKWLFAVHWGVIPVFEADSVRIEMLEVK